jgi:flagellar biosynthesis regulator FlaF
MTHSEKINKCPYQNISQMETCEHYMNTYKAGICSWFWNKNCNYKNKKGEYKMNTIKYVEHEILKKENEELKKKIEEMKKDGKFLIEAIENDYKPFIKLSIDLIEDLNNKNNELNKEIDLKNNIIKKYENEDVDSLREEYYDLETENDEMTLDLLESNSKNERLLNAIRTIKNQTQKTINFVSNIIGGDEYVLKNIDQLPFEENRFKVGIQNNIDNMKQMLKKLDEIMKTIYINL